MSSFVEKLIDEVRPTHDLKLLAKGTDPVALLAQRILDIEGSSERGQRLLHEASIRFKKLTNQGQWTDLDYEEREPLDYRSLLLRAGYSSLEQLLAQAAQPSGASPT